MSENEDGRESDGEDGKIEWLDRIVDFWATYIP